MFQHEAKMKSLNETIKEGDAKKRQLEEGLDALQEEVRGYHSIVFTELQVFLMFRFLFIKVIYQNVK